jgi:hypothetical protein
MLKKEIKKIARNKVRRKLKKKINLEEAGPELSL